MTDGLYDLHTVRPSVYLDQWVWVRLARAAAGQLDGADELAALHAIKSAAEAGVAFPLTSTHYFETLGITNPRQRADLAAVVAPISRFINLRSTRLLMRAQLLRAMHECFGRPAFRPHREDALGRGVHWAVTGREVLPKIMIDEREVTDAETPNRREMLRAMAQYAETKMFAGPEDDELPRLEELGYDAAAVLKSGESRLDWELVYAEIIDNKPVDRSEMRVQLVARELIHEHLELFNEVMNEYHLDIGRLLRADPNLQGSTRADMMRFSDMLPTMRIAAEMKVEQFRNPQRSWTTNMLYDIDAASRAIPYCHVVVLDGDAADMATRTRAGLRHGTVILSRMRDIPTALDSLLEAAATITDKSGWDEVGPPADFCMSWDQLTRVVTQPATARFQR